MNAATVIQLIVQVGLPLAIKLIEKWEKKENITSEELKALATSASLTARDHLMAVLKEQGIDPNSEQGKALLTAVG